jgi:hypothetical protein
MGSAAVAVSHENARLAEERAEAVAFHEDQQWADGKALREAARASMTPEDAEADQGVEAGERARCLEARARAHEKRIIDAATAVAEAKYFAESSPSHRSLTSQAR